MWGSAEDDPPPIIQVHRFACENQSALDEAISSHSLEKAFYLRISDKIKANALAS
jgi:hypothetical protein